MLSPTKNGSNNLGINGKSINRPLESITYETFVTNPARFKKYSLLKTAQSVLFDGSKEMKEQHRTCWCHRGTASANETVTVYRQTDGNSSRLHGVTTCKSVWGCPVCSAKICAVRQSELSGALVEWTKQGGYTWLMTLTFPHERHQALAEQLPKFTKAKAFFKNSKTYKRILCKSERKGSVTSLEVTLGVNGWHPHQHDLVFATQNTYGNVSERLDGSMDSSEITELKHAWYVALLKSGLCDSTQMNDVLKHGLDVRGGQYAAEYVAKFGREQAWGLSREVTMHACKNGNEKTNPHAKAREEIKGAHPFQLLAWAEKGDGLAVDQFREYIAAFEGKRMLTWSRGLKKDLTGLEEITDEQAADAEMPKEEIAGRIDSAAISTLNARNLMANFLAYVAEYCSGNDGQELIDDYLRDARSKPALRQGIVKTKMWSRGHMYTNRELENA